MSRAAYFSFSETRKKERGYFFFLLLIKEVESLDIPKLTRELNCFESFILAALSPPLILLVFASSATDYQNISINTLSLIYKVSLFFFCFQQIYQISIFDSISEVLTHWMDVIILL